MGTLQTPKLTDQIGELGCGGLEPEVMVTPIPIFGSNRPRFPFLHVRSVGSERARVTGVRWMHALSQWKRRVRARGPVHYDARVTTITAPRVNWFREQRVCAV